MDKDARNTIVPKGKSDREFAAEPRQNIQETAKSKVKFEIFGEEMIEKTVKLSGNSGRVYLPPTWVGHNVKIIRID
jgi:putative transposon-encoded protein